MANKRESKGSKSVPTIRGIVGRNVEILRDQVFSDLPTVTRRNEALAKRIGAYLPQIQRIVAGKVGTSIDTIEWLADALHVKPQDLLTPYFASSREAVKRPISVEAPAQVQLQRKNG